MIPLLPSPTLIEDNSHGSSERCRPIRGLTSCVAEGGSRSSVNASASPNPSIASTFRSSGHLRRGRTLGVQSLSGCTDHFVGFGNQPVWTEEPLSTTDPGGENVNSSGRASIEVSTPTPPVFNVAQAFALSQPTQLSSKWLKLDNDTSRSTSETKDDPEESMEAHSPSRLGSGPMNGKDPRGCQSRGYSKIPAQHMPPPKTRSVLRVGTDPAPFHRSARTNTPIIRPHPLRTSSTHSRDDAVLNRASASSLLASLFTGSRKPPTLFILAVAVAYNGLKDPQHDFDLMKKWLKDHEPTRVRFQGISGEEATRERIEDVIGELYREALRIPGARLLILLTGEGDYTNKMHLMGGRFITDSDLRIWLWKLRNGSKPISVPATIVLDYCRMSKHIPLGAMQKDVEFVWTCSLGQTAAALRLPSAEDIPRSCFLLVLMMSSYNRTSIKPDLDAAIDYELRRLSSFLDFTHKKAHREGLCIPCRNQRPCEIPVPSPQNPDWEQAGNMQPIHVLAGVLPTIGVNVVAKVYRVLMNNRWFREANQLPINWVTAAKRDPSNPGSAVRYKRGTCRIARS